MVKKKNIFCGSHIIDRDKVEKLSKKRLEDSLTPHLAETFKALGDSTRIKILYVLSKTELCVCDLSTLLNISSSAISHQLRFLRSLRLVKPRKNGRIVYYSLDDEHIVKLFKEGLDHVRHK